jgi:hypothetical protein
MAFSNASNCEHKKKFYFLSFQTLAFEQVWKKIYSFVEK